MINLKELPLYFGVSPYVRNKITYQLSGKTKKELDSTCSDTIKNNTSVWTSSIKIENFDYRIYSHVVNGEEIGIVVSNNKFNILTSPDCEIGCCGQFLMQENKDIEELTNELLIELLK